ncbi:MAG: NDP-sugar synthase [bacterium]
MRAFVLAAGRGERLGPLGERVPKPLLPLGGTPLIRFALAKLRRAGVEEAVVNLHHGAEALRAELGEECEGLRLRFSHEPELLGTAGGLKKAEPFLCETGEPFFVLNADTPCGADLGAALEHHRRGGFLATLILRAAPEAARYGLLGVDGEGRLRRFLEARAPGPAEGGVTEAMFTGLSVLDPALLGHIPPGRPCGISEEVYPPLIEGGARIGGFLTDAYWADAGTPGRFLDANADLLSGRYVPELEWPRGGALLLEGREAPWGEGLLRPPVLVGEGAELGPGAVAGPFAILGSGATLGRNASAARTVLFPGARVAKGVSLDRCIVGAGAAAAPAGTPFGGAVFLADSGDPHPF